MTLIGYWPLNEASGSKVYDHSGNENHGTINDGGDSTIPGATGVLGQNAYSFDGSNDYVRISDSSELDNNLMEGFSISVWVNISIPDGGDGNDHEIIGKDTDFSLFIRGDADLRLDNDNDGGFTTDAGDWSNWVHLVATVDKNGDGTLYENNSKLATGSFPLGKMGSSNDVYVGAREWDNARYYNGKISEVRLYDRPLTQSEIHYLYSVGKRGLQATGKKSS